MRKIPATMSTQHPDHASKPYWHDDEFISAQHESYECFLSFSDLGITEYMWDWEGKFVDEAIIERLMNHYFEYFQENPLGKEKFLTFRLPNPQVQTEFRLGRALFNILSAGNLARQVNQHTPPLFEVMLPMTTSADDMIAIQEAFREITSLKHPLLKFDEDTLKHLEIIPLVEEVPMILDADKLFEDYIAQHKKLFGFVPKYVRPLIARSDPAMNSGLVATVLSIKIGLSRLYVFAEKHKIKMYPILGAASLPFRGGISPDTIDQFIKEYPGIRTTTIQSAFKYDYEKEKVISAIKKLEKELPKTKVQKVPAKDEKVLREMIGIFEKHFKVTIEGIAPIINGVAKHIPKRRERVQHVGLFGYSRGVGNVKLPRAIGFTAALYSVGAPPEIIGTGRGLKEIAKDKTKMQNLEKYYVNIKDDLRRAGRYVNKEVIHKLAETAKEWKMIEEDIEGIEKYLGEELKPKTYEEKEHHLLSEKIYEYLQAGKNPQDSIVRAAILRKSLG